MTGGYETLLVVSRFGLLDLRRHVLAHNDGRWAHLPGNDLLPIDHGMVVMRGLQEQTCRLAHDLPFASAVRLLGWHTGIPASSAPRWCGTWYAAMARIRAPEQGEALHLTRYGTHGQRLRVPHQ